MVLAHTYSTWYWTLDKTKLPFFTLTAAIRSTTRYHLGSIAVGSMILAIGQVFCKFIKTLVDNPCNLCCRINGIAQRLLRFFNNNSFIMVAIHGDPFCKSMRDAFNLLMRSDVFITSRITKLLFTIFNLFVAVGTGVLTYMLLPEHGSNQLNDDSIMYYVTIAISVYGSFIVGSRFSGVYITAVDTLFLCYMEDCERNEGTEEKPHYMSPELMRLLHKNAEIVPPPEQV
ncbi:choline transporter-like 2 [Bradysia coprophila]|uniref:choline transporter-like 2 n=1 Tax=Bradysia coprophila TaxID=38358 RepID=UPI00187DA382|nr:choline transporter-like 2 [Bradysia coprophila]